MQRLAAPRSPLVLATQAYAQTRKPTCRSNGRGRRPPLPVSIAPKPPPAPRPPPPEPDGPRRQTASISKPTNLIRDDHNKRLDRRGGSVEARYQSRVVRADKVVYDIASGTVRRRWRCGHRQSRPDHRLGRPRGARQEHARRLSRLRLRFARDPQTSPSPPLWRLRRSETVNELKPGDLHALRRLRLGWEARRADLVDFRPVRRHPGPQQAAGLLSGRGAQGEGRAGLLHAGVLARRPVVAARLGACSPRPSPIRTSLGFKLPAAVSAGDLALAGTDHKSAVQQQCEHPLLNLEWTKRFYSGQVDVRVGYTYDPQFSTRRRP